jgi:hypothetical protein
VLSPNHQNRIIVLSLRLQVPLQQSQLFSHKLDGLSLLLFFTLPDFITE